MGFESYSGEDVGSGLWEKRAEWPGELVGITKKKQMITISKMRILSCKQMGKLLICREKLLTLFGAISGFVISRNLKIGKFNWNGLTHSFYIWKSEKLDISGRTESDFKNLYFLTLGGIPDFQIPTILGIWPHMCGGNRTWVMGEPLARLTITDLGIWP